MLNVAPRNELFSLLWVGALSLGPPSQPAPKYDKIHIFETLEPHKYEKIHIFDVLEPQK
jgi:hypothetical protein